MKKQIIKITMNNRTIKIYENDNFVPTYLVYRYEDGKNILHDGYDSLDKCIADMIYYCKYGE